MPILAEQSTFYVKRLIMCPGHWLISPKVDIYQREPVPLLKDCSNFVELKGIKIHIKKNRIKKDAYGRKLVDWKKMYELRKIGQVLHPKVSAAWAIEHVYDPLSYICQHCDKRCKEGSGGVMERTIKRLCR